MMVAERDLVRVGLANTRKFSGRKEGEVEDMRGPTGTSHFFQGETERDITKS